MKITIENNEEIDWDKLSEREQSIWNSGYEKGDRDTTSNILEGTAFVLINIFVIMCIVKILIT